VRVTVRKFLFYGARDDRKAFFHRAQRAGIVEFSDLPSREIPAAVHEFNAANKVLRHLEPAPKEELPDLDQALPIARRVNHLHHLIESYHEEE